MPDQPFRRGGKTEQTIMMHYPGAEAAGKLAGVMINPVLAAAAVSALNAGGYQPSADDVPPAPLALPHIGRFRPGYRTGMTLFADPADPDPVETAGGQLIGMLFTPQLTAAAAAGLNLHRRLQYDRPLFDLVARYLCALEGPTGRGLQQPWAEAGAASRALHRTTAATVLSLIDDYLQGAVDHPETSHHT